MNEDEKDLERLAKKYGGEVVLPEMFNDIQACFMHDVGGYWVSWIEYAGAKRKLARCDLMGEVRSTIEYYPEEGVLQDHFDSAEFGLILTPTDLIAVDAATDG